MSDIEEVIRRKNPRKSKKKRKSRVKVKRSKMIINKERNISNDEEDDVKSNFIVIL